MGMEALASEPGVILKTVGLGVFDTTLEFTGLGSIGLWGFDTTLETVGPEALGTTLETLEDLEFLSLEIQRFKEFLEEKSIGLES